MSCRAHGCRFPASHATAGHKCGLCGRHGHGQYECRDLRARRALLPHLADRVDRPCAVKDCPYAAVHRTEGHACGLCGTHGGGACAFCALAIEEEEEEVAIEKEEEVARHVSCPHCKVVSDVVDLACTVYTAADCTVCLESGPCVLLPACRHANVCAACVRRIARL